MVGSTLGDGRVVIVGVTSLLGINIEVDVDVDVCIGDSVVVVCATDRPQESNSRGKKKKKIIFEQCLIIKILSLNELHKILPNGLRLVLHLSIRQCVYDTH